MLNTFRFCNAFYIIDPIRATREGKCVIMHCRLRRHKLFIFLKSDFGQQFKTQAVYRLRRYMYRLRRYRQQQQLLMLPHLGYI